MAHGPVDRSGDGSPGPGLDDNRSFRSTNRPRAVLRDVVDRYWIHPEPKSAAPHYGPCELATKGLLRRRRIRRGEYLYVSNEARRLEDVQHGQVHRWSDVQDVFVDRESEWMQRPLPGLRAIKRSDARAY